MQTDRSRWRSSAGLAAMLLLAALLFSPPAQAADAKFLETYEKAQELYRDGAYDKALKLYERAYALSPVPEVSYGIARCHHQLGNYSEAVKAYDRFLVASPGHSGAVKARVFVVEALLAHGAAEIGSRNYGSARAAFERALEIHSAASPEGKDAVTGTILVGLGETLLALGDKRGARERLGRALETALSPSLKERADTLLVRARGDGAAKPSSVLPEESPDDHPAVSASGDDATGSAAKPKNKGTRLGVWLGIGGGVLGVAVVTTVIAVVATRPPQPDLGWISFDFGS